MEKDHTQCQHDIHDRHERNQLGGDIADRLMPPIRIRAMMIARATPMIRLTSFTASAGSMLKLLRAESMAVVIVLTCVALPVPNTASTPKAANKYARKCHFYPVRS